jgi:hypothetical protein
MLSEGVHEALHYETASDANHHSTPERIDRAWAANADWVTEWDGGYTAGSLPDVPPQAVAPAIGEVVQRFGLTEIQLHAATDDGQDFINTLDELDDQLSVLDRLGTEDLIMVIMRYEILDAEPRIPVQLYVEYDLDLRPSVELVWWANQVFLAEADHYCRFVSVMSHLLWLQELFQSPRVLIGSEGTSQPSEV